MSKPHFLTCSCVSFSLAMLAAGSAAAAQDTGPYASAGIAYATSNADEFGDVKEDSAQLQARLGYAITPHIAVEAEGSFAAHKTDVGGPPATARLVLDRYVAAFAVARLPLSEHVSIHGRAGYATGTAALEAPGARETESFDDFAFGVGMAYHWDRNAIRADYTVLTSNFDNGQGPDLNHRLLGIAYVRSF